MHGFGILLFLLLVLLTLNLQAFASPASLDEKADLYRGFLDAVRAGDLPTVQRYVESENLDPSWLESKSLRIASKYGYLDLVEFLLGDERVDPAAEGNDAVYLAASGGHLAVVNRLLLDTRVDPSGKHSSVHVPIEEAALNGHLDVVNRLLLDGVEK